MRNASKIDPACSSISNAMRKISTMDAAVQTEPLALFFALDSCGDWRAHGQFNEKQREVLNDLEKVLNKTNLDSLKASFGEMMPSMQLVHSSTSADNLENDMNAVSSTKTSPVKEDTQRVDKKQDDFKAFDREKPTRKNTSKASPTFKRLVNGLSFGQLDDLEQIIKNSSTAGSEENVGVISKELQSFKSVSAEDISNASQLVSIKKYCLNAEAKEFVPQNVSVADVAEDKASEATVTASCGSEIQKRTASKSKSNESHEVSKQAPKREWIKKSDSLKHKLAPKLASSEVPSGKTSECVSKDVSGPEAHQVVSLESPEAEVSKISNITSTDEKSLSAPSTDVSISVSPVEPSVGEANVSLKQNSNRSSSKSSLQVNPSPENKPAVDVVPKIPVKPPGSPKATKLSTTKPEVKQTAWNKPAWLKRQLQDAKEEGKHPSSVSRPVVRNVGNQVPGHFVKPVVRRIVPKVPTTSVKTALSSSSLSSCSTTSSGDVASKRKRIVDDDGWETVKGRSRSRISPVKSMMESSNDVSRSSENILRRSSVASSVRPRPAHERFLLPSGAVSLPSVVVIDDVCDDRSSHSTVSKQASLGTGPVEELKTEKSLEARVVSESEVTKNADPKKQRPSPNNERALKKKTKKKSQEDISSRVAAPVSESKSSSTGVGIDVSQRVGKSSASLGVLTVLDSPRSPELNPDADAILDAQDDEELKANEQAFASVVKEEETLEEAMRLEFEKGAAEEAAERERLTNGVSTEDEVDDHVHSIDDSGDLEQLKALSVTYDGKLGRQSSRVFHIHEKLSSPSRRTTAEECMKRREERQAKADELRQSRLQSHKEKMEELTRKIEEVRAMKSRLLEKNRMTTERKLKRAEEKRKLHLQSIVKKAHDEEEKAKEIAFINSLEASNKRQEINQQLQIVEARLQEKNDERQRKNEEKAAKEAAAEERRKVMEAERLARIDVIVKKREYRERQIAEDMTRKEELRLQLAREKARSREERVSAINAKQIADAQKLQRKIALKHEESARRHEEKIDDIRRKAFESTVLKYSTASDDSPTLVSYETAKMCTLCQVIIGSEIYLLSHLKGQVHRSAVGGACVNTDEMGLFNLAHIVDAPDDEVYKTKVRLDVDRQKACRKRCGKLRSRMHQRAQDFSQWLSNATGDTKLVKSKDPDEIKLLRCVKDVEKLVASQAGGRSRERPGRQERPAGHSHLVGSVRPPVQSVRPPGRSVLTPVGSVRD
ncbi:unnamed protein product [Notodromas monacha]|uniref:Uncharacterized protein n=1 Tax=Notodromas monacha TaxID=399045 RepID=A0A7R9GBQ0_9CRUS|nr:unnamed protein product [Notodromas monacha]CAG0916757.1 unnamed protein product [Notodromas monacha]